MGNLFQEIIHWQVGDHRKPTAALNTAGYYDYLPTLFKYTVEQDLIHQECLTSANDSFAPHNAS